MSETKLVFDQIVEDMLANEAVVVSGKMMSSPGLKYNGKVFAFYHQNTMGFRLGKAFDPEAFGSTTARFLNPFKNKPPMRAWFIIEDAETELWRPLAYKALAFTQSL